MDFIRKHICTKALAFVAGLAFLNMSFFLAEVSYLNFQKGELLENIAKLILNTGFEEERDGETSNESSIKGIPVIPQVRIHACASSLLSVRVTANLVDLYRHADHSLVFSPPPDLS
jgi:hypothetical protein